MTSNELINLQQRIEGDVMWDETTLIAYATDASAYREKPTVVVRPRHTADIVAALAFAREHKMPVVPRAAGTSLAGQVVGRGLILDVSRYMTQILELNVAERWVRVQPGVVRDELNLFLREHGLFFGPETSTSNRCMIGGMLGNNACGAQSVLYGSTRDHTLEVEAVLSDGSQVHFAALDKVEFEQKCELQTLEGSIYRHTRNVLTDEFNQREIREQFPKPDIYRRNTGYAIDLMLRSEVFTEGGEPFNFCRLLAGSEGTLAVSTEIKLNLVPLPKPVEGVVAAHFHTLDEALRANIVALKYDPSSVELMDDIIIECTRGHKEHEANRFFIEGNPKAVLMIQFERNTEAEINDSARAMEAELRSLGMGYHFPLVTGADTKKVWNLRKAGLGLLSNVEGPRRSTTVIEDTAVSVHDLPEYIAEFQHILDKHQLSCVYYAHVGSGELHLRPMLDLKNPDDLKLFRAIGHDIALLVKKYNGSLSGEHGDGRLRGEFIPLMLGEHNYQLLRELKQVWDPENLLNPGKIVDAPPMDESLRLDYRIAARQIDTVFHFSEGSVLQAAERCNGSGDCRKSEIMGGTMCPSFKATRDEQHTTRARANVLREMLTRSSKQNPFDHKELYQVFDLCLACKACKSECPSSVDVAKLKMEFLQQYYDANGAPLRSRLIASITRMNSLASLAPWLYNALTQWRPTGQLLMRMLGFAPQRSMPRLSAVSFRQRLKREKNNTPPTRGQLYLFADEFTNYNESELGIRTLQVLHRLGYEVQVPTHMESGRALLSKGFLRKARKIAIENVQRLAPLISADSPLVGIEPSAILTFRDEYPDLIGPQYRISKRYGANLYEQTRHLARHTLTIEEFLAREIDAGRITPADFGNYPYELKLHGHCQQKALVGTAPARKMLSVLPGVRFSEIPSGCCGMAGSFGYEAEHYALSMKIGEQVLFPAVRKTTADTRIVAAGTSCRHQIAHSTGRKALHPIEIWWEALFLSPQNSQNH